MKELNGSTGSLRVLAGLASMAALMLLTSCGNAASAATSTTTSLVDRGTIQTTASATGRIQASQQVQLNFSTPGKVVEVLVKAGDTVRRGTVLARLDSFQAQTALSKAHTQLQMAEADLVIATSNVSRTLLGPSMADVAAAQAALAAAGERYKALAAGPLPATYAEASAQLRNAEAALRQAQAAYDNANRQNPASISAHPAALALEQATNNYQSAKAAYDRLSAPASSADKSAALQQISTAKASLVKLKAPPMVADIERARAEQTQAHIRIEQAKLAVKEAQHLLPELELVAPFDGVVAEVNLAVGERADAASSAAPPVVLISVAQFWVDVDVDEVDVAQLQPGQEALIQIDALPNTSLKGKVDQIAVTSKLVNGVVSYAVRVVLDGRQAPLKPGMTATTRIVLSQKKNVLRVPNEAIRRDLQTGRAFISVSATELNDDGSDDTTGKATDPTTHEVEVTLGLQDTDYTEIVSGAQEGQVVLINSGK